MSWKLSRTVLTGGKGGDNFKALPIRIVALENKIANKVLQKLNNTVYNAINVN
ncbi:hypothetical protein NPD7_854 [Clostridium sporogenes]|uniref:hypothetical protein n=1 Tax=Clostridium TaxID=1485 RepID=UPI00090A1ABB|nr:MULTISPECIES: hypothetical protein [Clostridium]APF26398.1 hypothetical protein NPD7_854 [Clostridium sporogenes]MDI6918069.1 hypothetical protein [Clostridium botulinum]WMU96310.1 hypothetical protein QA656_11040 [Clostridium botulinum]